MIQHYKKRVTLKQCCPFFYACLFLMVLVFPILTNAAEVPETVESVKSVNSGDDQNEIRQLIDAGAYKLALTILDSEQSRGNADDPEGWMQQQRLRVEIYQLLNDQNALVNYIQAVLQHPLLANSAVFKRWFQTRQAEALIKLHQGEQALAVLRELIWSIPMNIPTVAQDLLEWRRMVIQAYRVAGYQEDAYRAALRLQRDYSEIEFTDLMQYARILLATERYEQAMELLEGKAAEPEAGMLFLFAQLHNQSRSAKTIVQAGLRQMRAESTSTQLKAQLWAVVAQAAQQSADRATTANALEHVVADQQIEQFDNDLFNISPDVLWNAYFDYAVAIGNEAQFLIGMDEQWLAAAESAEKQYPVRARSLYALLILKGQSQETRDRAVKRFIISMFERKQGKPLLRRLFLESEIFSSYDKIPLPARHALTDVALGESKIELASALMATINKPPKGTDQFNWYLRRVRILVMGGKAEQGAASLQEMLQDNTVLIKEQLDHLMQVIFDLQTMGMHSHAYSLFADVLNKTEDMASRREIYYWMAESLKADKKYTQAGRYFLKSAMLLEPGSMDPWAQTARYQAAESLAKAGLLSDARILYQQLLKVTKDESRRAVLQREIQKLWLNNGETEINQNTE